MLKPRVGTNNFTMEHPIIDFKVKFKKKKGGGVLRRDEMFYFMQLLLVLS